MTTMGNPFLQNSDWMQAGQNLMSLATNARGRLGRGGVNPNTAVEAQLNAQTLVENERRDRMLGEAQDQSASLYNFKDPNTNQPVAVNVNDATQQAELRMRVTRLLAGTIPFANQPHVRENLADALAGISALNQDERTARAMWDAAGRTPGAHDYATTTGQEAFNTAERQTHLRGIAMQQAGETGRTAMRLQQENRNVSPDQVVGSIYRRVAQGGPGITPAEQAIIDQHSGPIVVDGVAYSRPSMRLPTIDEQPGGGQPSRFTGVTQQVFGQPGGMQPLTPPRPPTLSNVQAGVAQRVADEDPTLTPAQRSLVPDSTHRPPAPTLSNIQASIAARIAANDPTVTQAERDLVPTHQPPAPTLSAVQARIAERIARNDPTLTQAERDLVPTHAPPDYNLPANTDRRSGRTGDVIATGTAPGPRGRPPSLDERHRVQIMQNVYSNMFGRSMVNVDDADAVVRMLPSPEARGEFNDAVASRFASTNDVTQAARAGQAVLDRYLVGERRNWTNNDVSGFTVRPQPLPAPDSAAAPFTPGAVARSTAAPTAAAPAPPRVVQPPPAAAAPTPAPAGAGALPPLSDTAWSAAVAEASAEIARAPNAQAAEAIRQQYLQVLTPRAGGRQLPPALRGQSG